MLAINRGRSFVPVPVSLTKKSAPLAVSFGSGSGQEQTNKSTSGSQGEDSFLSSETSGIEIAEARKPSFFGKLLSFTDGMLIKFEDLIDGLINSPTTNLADSPIEMLSSLIHANLFSRDAIAYNNEKSKVNRASEKREFEIAFA